MYIKVIGTMCMIVSFVLTIALLKVIDYIKLINKK